MITYGSIRPSQVHVSKFDASSPKPTKHLGHDIGFSDAVSRGGSIWVRSVTQSIGFTQSYNDFYDESLSHTLSFTQLAVGNVDRNRSLSDTIGFTDSFVWAGTPCDGTGGGGTELIDATFTSITKKGMAVYVDGSATCDLAQADAIATTKCVGLATTDVAAAAAGQYQTEGTITQADWTLVTGAAALTPGAYYWLSAAGAGQLTTTAPTTISQFVVAVGRALSTTQMDIEIAQPVLL